MADSAFQVQYRQEFVFGFEQRQSLLRDAVTTEFEQKGGSAVFLVADSGGAQATTRGLNGLIPARADNLTQNTCTLAEWHDLVRKTGFNVFASQGNQTALMQNTTMAVINRKIDQDIITELNTATNDTGTAAPGSVGLALKAQTILGNLGVPSDGNVWGLITPAFRAYLMQSTEFSSADYVRRAPFDGSQTAWRDQPGFYDWMEVKWIVHPNLPGVGTNAEKCFLFHKSAIGHAIDMNGLQTPVGYDAEQDYSWARASGFFGSKLLQGNGVCVINHDGSAFAAQ